MCIYTCIPFCIYFCFYIVVVDVVYYPGQLGQLGPVNTAMPTEPEQEVSYAAATPADANIFQSILCLDATMTNHK